MWRFKYTMSINKDFDRSARDAMKTGERKRESEKNAEKGKRLKFKKNTQVKRYYKYTS